jgi:hydrogenase 3 maturation protease
MDETKTLPPTWKTALSQLLQQPTSNSGNLRIAILGVGNEMRSDDAAGVLVARRLASWEWATHTDRILIIEAGQAPENRTGELRTFAPDLVLIVDAADMGEKPGAIQFIPEESIDGMSASTHSLPLSMLAHYLRMDLGCLVALLGIQIRSNEVGENVSRKVLQAVNEIVDELDRSLSTR